MAGKVANSPENSAVSERLPGRKAAAPCVPRQHRTTHRGPCGINHDGSRVTARRGIRPLPIVLALQNNPLLQGPLWMLLGLMGMEPVSFEFLGVVDAGI